MSGLYETPRVPVPTAPAPGEPAAFDFRKHLAASDRQTAQAQPISRGPNSILTDEQIQNIVYNETRGLSGSNIQRARVALAHTIMNADEIWGPQRGRTSKDGPAGTAPDFLKALPVSDREKAAMTDVTLAVSAARAQRHAGIDPTNGATNFHMRPFRSTNPPPHGIAQDSRYTFQPEGNPFGPYDNDEGRQTFINIWQNPIARRRRR